MLTPFHIAVGVRNLIEADQFYSNILGLSKGRSSNHWIDFNMYGHQFVVHLDESLGQGGSIQAQYNDVDEKPVPIPHCGVVLPMTEWQALADRLCQAGLTFIIEPYIRFEGQLGEQGTMFFSDPSGNALEFKGFTDIDSQLFAN